jgi:hypothetical protein
MSLGADGLHRRKAIGALGARPKRALTAHAATGNSARYAAVSA